MNIPSSNIQFPSGGSLQLTSLGLGTAPLGNLYCAVSDTQARATLDCAWTSGIRYFDTAPLYGFGLAETRLNSFLRQHPRSSYVLSTKVGRLLKVCAPGERSGIGKFFETPSRQEVFDYSYDGVMRSVESSLERLGIDRIDMLFAHDLDVFTHGSQAGRDKHVADFMAGGYRALLQLRDEKVVTAIGAGVNEWQVCQMLAEQGDFDAFLLAGRHTLLEQEALESFLPLCQQRGIQLVIGGAYNSGILATGAVPGAFYNYEPAPESVLKTVARIEKVCQQHEVKLIEAALRFPLLHPAVATVVIGATSPAEIDAGLAILGKTVPAAFWQNLKQEGLLRRDAPVASV